MLIFIVNIKIRLVAFGFVVVLTLIFVVTFHYLSGESASVFSSFALLGFAFGSHNLFVDTALQLSPAVSRRLRLYNSPQR